MQHEVVAEIFREWTRLKEKNPAISLRAFSKRIEVSHSALSEILSGKRRLTKKMALRILDKLNLTDEQHLKIKEFYDANNKFDLIDLNNFKLISHWQPFAVLNLLKLKDFQFEYEWMAKRLGLSQKEVALAVDRLRKSGLIEISPTGEIERSSKNNLKTPTGTKNLALQNFTKESLEQASKSVSEDPIDRRDFSTVTLTINQKDMKKAKKLIEEFRYKFDREIESIPGDDVYKLIIGLYPLTKEVTDE